ncbi:uncharacterized protein isoform X2 [Takifugu rubripes]|uniref:uncharacterized protein isoform X2 n=1 Tax=Takifugu rubripes TaxID=31033 RepID=UPI0011455647|nr:uncharacterized protein LOC115253206 isoform X2 [Takifugu rubripes]
MFLVCCHYWQFYINLKTHFKLKTAMFATKLGFAIVGFILNSAEHSTITKWFKLDGTKWTEVLVNGSRLKHQISKDTHLTLSVMGLTKDDKTSYCCNEKPENCYEDHIQLTVTDIKVKISPSTEVTEGDRVKLTCNTSCPLTNNKNYIWYLNDQLLQLPEHQNKHLVLAVVTPQHAGNYSCAVNTQRDVRSPEKTLRVQSSSLKWTLTAAAGVRVALLVFTSLVIIWIIKSKFSNQHSGPGMSDNIEMQNPESPYENVATAKTEQDDHQYSRLHFTRQHTDDLYAALSPLSSNSHHC